MQAIRKVLRTEAGKVLIDIPVDKDEKSDTYYLLKMQEQTGYVQALYNDPDEDVWNEE